MLESKSVLITGGGGGIGRAAALAAAREGARVAVADVDSDAAHQTVQAIAAAGGDSFAIPCDVSDNSQVHAMIQAVVSKYGRIDCAFNNAGIGTAQLSAGGTTQEWTEEEFDRMLAVNLKGVWLCLKHELPQMLLQGVGAIVNTSSIGGLIGFPAVCGYVAAKHGVIGLTKTAALENAELNIRVNAICPGIIETSMTQKTRQTAGSQLLSRIPMGRVGQPDEIAEIVVWLFSDRASYVNGVSYNVDGGFLAI